MVSQNLTFSPPNVDSLAFLIIVLFRMFYHCPCHLKTSQGVSCISQKEERRVVQNAHFIIFSSCSEQGWRSQLNFNGFDSCSGAKFSKLLNSSSGAGLFPFMALTPALLI